MVSSQNCSPEHLGIWPSAIARLTAELMRVERAGVEAQALGDWLALIEARRARRRLLARIEAAKAGAMNDDRTIAVVA